MSDFLTEKRREIAARMTELRPAVQEAERLQAALDALDGVTAAATAPAPASRRRSPAAPRTAKGSRRRRPQRRGQRGKQALALVKSHPGIEIPALAERMGMSTTQRGYLYRVLPALAEQGLVEQRGRGWHPTATAA
ncbi:MAG: hypothetical protein LC798_12275 [Chloroflexi bacterium]|nr:hypothetical protein [Chloroflexota bacterium]